MPKKKDLKTEFSEVNFGTKGMVEREERVFTIKGGKLRNLRQSKGLSLRQFAESLSRATGIIYDHTHIDRWEKSAKFQVGLSEVQAFINIVGEK
jgi:hypothetical protein